MNGYGGGWLAQGAANPTNLCVQFHTHLSLSNQHHHPTQTTHTNKNPQNNTYAVLLILSHFLCDIFSNTSSSYHFRFTVYSHLELLIIVGVSNVMFFSFFHVLSLSAHMKRRLFENIVKEFSKSRQRGA